MESAIEQGDAYAMGVLGVKYTLGEGVPEDREKAYELFEKAAELGDVFSQTNLGLCYLFGDGVKKNERKAYNWFSKAAYNGNACAKVQLANLMVNGEKIAHDYARAESLYKEVVGAVKKEATDLDDIMSIKKPLVGFVDRSTYNDAAINLAILYTEFFRYYEKAFPLLKEMAEVGYAEAQYYLGVAYMYARGTEINKENAKYWLKKAVEQGHSSAEYHLNILENE